MIKWGITGGIGAGKSYVAGVLCDKLNMPIYNCDSRAKFLMKGDSMLREKLINTIGPQVYGEDFTLNKEAIASFLFQSETNTKLINSIVHPVVRRDFHHWLEQQSASYIGLESAILFESGFREEVDRVLYVDAPKKLRIERVVRRDKSNQESVEQRMNRQHCDEFRSMSDLVFINDGTNDVLDLVNKMK